MNDSLLAQKFELPGISPIEGPLPTLIDAPGTYRFNNLGDIISELLKYLFPISLFIVFLYIVYAGFQLLTSSGDPKRVEAGRKRLTYAILGFFLLIAAYWITQIFQLILSPNQPFF